MRWGIASTVTLNRCHKRVSEYDQSWSALAVHARATVFPVRRAEGSVVELLPFQAAAPDNGIFKDVDHFRIGLPILDDIEATAGQGIEAEVLGSEMSAQIIKHTFDTCFTMISEELLAYIDGVDLYKPLR